MAEDAVPSCPPKFATGHELVRSSFIDSVTFYARVGTTAVTLRFTRIETSI